MKYSDMKNSLPLSLTCLDTIQVTSVEVKNPTIIEGDTVRILLNGGEFAVIDLADLPLVAHVHWFSDGNGYARARLWQDGRLIYPRLHRFLLGREAEGWRVDHKNGLRWDSRRDNLRCGTQAQNALNRGLGVRNSTGYKGVRRQKSGVYFVQIKSRGQQHRVGKFETPEEAARAYDFLATSFWGDWARLNFPKGSEDPSASPRDYGPRDLRWCYNIKKGGLK